MAGLTQRELAQLADCSLAWVGNAEGGYVPRTSPTLVRVLEALEALNDVGPATNGAEVKVPGRPSGHGST